MKFSTLRKSRRNSALRDQVLRIMKLVIVIMITALLQVSASSFGQRITLSQKKISLKQVLKEIRKQSNYSILCDSKILQQAKPVDLQVKDASVEEVLNDFFINQPFNYVIAQNTIVINRKTDEGNLLIQKTFLPIKGKLTDEKGEPLVGVSVSVKGQSTVTQTDANGAYSIVANKGDILIFTYVGYATQEIAVGDNAIINVTLKETAQGLSDVVVTALGIKREASSLTYNVQRLNGSTVNDVKDPSFINSLTGKVAGLTINKSASGLGGSTKAVFRGNKSISQNNNALYVVDGIPLPNLFSGQPGDPFGGGDGGDGISNINPDDIEEISALSGASAAALYGGQAANGVILITTKKGKVGAPKVSFSSNVTLEDPFILPKFQNKYGQSPSTTSTPSLFSWGPKQASIFDPKSFFNTGKTFNNSVSFMVGNEKSQSYFSAASVNAEGIIPGNKFNRYNFTARNSTNYFNDKLNVDVSVSYINQRVNNRPGQGQYKNPIISLFTFPRTGDFAALENYQYYNPTRNLFQEYFPYGLGNERQRNPYYVANKDLSTENRNRFMASATLKYNFTDWLNLQGRVKIDRTNDINDQKYDAGGIDVY
ncbi:SusC/RagA family TonB-linked outer membrane protein [Pedobacter paludis]|uniref:TonB-dependent receptor plug domain-containing protein n=1 Tax=Pedobacter paludis TaxID=2203212 RepID=A0A317F5S0_9SPHI|nr:SusC/RagA family TonB-linked outer membrane protein [Pedobacter paludis]PWS32866.1 hypothetical protein DF947_07290 [Pedobacter paludis]